MKTPDEYDTAAATDLAEVLGSEFQLELTANERSHSTHSIRGRRTIVLATTNSVEQYQQVENEDRLATKVLLRVDWLHRHHPYQQVTKQQANGFCTLFIVHERCVCFGHRSSAQQ